MSPDSIPRTEVHQALRINLPYFAAASIVLAAGIASFCLVRLRSRSHLPLWLGLFSTLYALRLFLDNDLVRAALNISFLATLPWILCLTYSIPIPYALFARELLGRGWQRSITIWLWIEVCFASVAIPTALLSPGARWPNAANGLLIIAGTVLILLHVLLRPTGSDSFGKSLTYSLFFAGVLVVLENRGFRPGRFSLEPLGFLILLGGLALTAAQRALGDQKRLMEIEQELATAHRIQSAIIPASSPQIGALLIAARYLPMTSVAGDFYDFLAVGENCLTILVADVSGHGVPAALVASMLKICFAAQREYAQNPAEILSRLNFMLRDNLGGQYVTAACAAIDLAAGTITYAGAGHPPSLLLHKAEGRITELSENGLFIGPFPQAIYTSVVTHFAPGDKLLLYTDGIVEAELSDGEEFGRGRLQTLLADTADLDPAQFIDRLFQAIATPFQQDDLTVVLVQLG